ncbi:hypothetical protein PAT3040_01751 [Paenibacillus agaridevorans]|uniref:CDP-Glycerol:Poly(Glycerophosphate) glycerophosphotransferase n=1 Tax=Paenibacillus agaridevorans TaxID=171404 RepID=A0A2R5ETU2_9BACL|nr:hypothetical protein [Paenibacillus agaridevorans]GBG07203.1 hypothetical protein PAT3040_01751 [Paenibacillus agaridevorans]
MRKHVQKQLLDLVATVWEGVVYATAPTTDHRSATTVLDDCQVAVGAIDRSLQDGLSEVRYFFYKKLNLDVLNLLNQLASHVTENVHLALEEQLNRIYSELMNEPEVKLEIVFLPYKASMWDSLESIWRAAQVDPHCNSYVVPIPYFDRNADGTIREAHYEGNDFPEYVTITNFNQYDIVKHQPDVIYIHNPFDDRNAVTIVHPDYFSSELKKHTNLLVYVPYFVLGGGISDSQTVSLPVYEHMDLMIVQSEKYKEIYAQFIPEHKLMALGSPKIDRIVQSQMEKEHMPISWRSIIGHKKVVFYNVSLSSIYQYGTKVLTKMKYVFDVFAARKDIVLLWRPHPLMESTLMSLDSSLYEHYQGLKRQFVSNDLGIYDTKPDMGAAIEVSDAYVGEETSSIVHLFGSSGKPILITDTIIDQKPEQEDIAALAFYDAYFEGDSAWFAAIDYNAICKIDIKSGKAELICKLPTSNPGQWQYYDILKVGDKLYVLPMNATDLCEYDLNTRTLKIIPIPDAGTYNFDRMIHYGYSLILKPKCYPAILKYDLRSDDFIKYSDPIKPFLRDDQPSMFMWAVCTRGSRMLIGSAIDNRILEFEMESGELEIHTVGSMETNFFAMAFDGKDYWFVPNEGRAIVRWNYETKKTIEYTAYPEGFEGESRLFAGIVYCGGYLLAFPRSANMIIRIDAETGDMTEYRLSLPYEEGGRKSGYYQYVSQYYFSKKLDDNRVAALSAYDNRLVIIDLETEEMNSVVCKLRMQDVEQCIAEMNHFTVLNDNLPYASRENRYLSINDFIERYVLRNEHNRFAQQQSYANEINNMDGSSGEKIHHYVKGQFDPHEG